MSRHYNQISLDEYRLLPRELLQECKCAQCGALFRECNNIGKYACRTHPGLRLIEPRSGRTFYSCCNYFIDTCDYDHILIQKGCLQLDHMTCLLSDKSIEERLSQLKAFASFCLPSLLLSYLDKPLQTSILKYNQSCMRFEYPLLVLEKVSTSYHEKSLTATKHNFDDAKNKPEEEEEKSFTLVFDVKNIMAALAQKSTESPLFVKKKTLMEQERQILTQNCELAWRTDFSAPVQQQKELCLSFETIPFVIIRRINKKLDI
jgi:hypothetical protein